MISIVIPTYNEEKVIGKTLKYLAKYRKKHNLELIVSDAKSTDKTVSIARKYADKVVVEKRRNTIAAGRNYGAFAASGDIIIEMDADSMIQDPDIFFPMVWQAFKDETVVAATPIFGIYKEEEIFKDKFFHLIMNFNIVVVNKVAKLAARGECQIFRTSAFKQIGGYNAALVATEDCDLFHRISKIGKVKILRKLKVLYSPRRYRKFGYMRIVFWEYVRNALYLIFTKKSYSKVWTPVR